MQGNKICYVSLSFPMKINLKTLSPCVGNPSVFKEPRLIIPRLPYSLCGGRLPLLCLGGEFIHGLALKKAFANPLCVILRAIARGDIFGSRT